MNTIKLVVRNIIGESQNGYSRVTVSNEVFSAIRGARPAIAYTAMGDKGGKGVRIFSFGDVKLYAHYDKVQRNTVFLMETAEAQKHLVTLAQERAGEAKLPFDVSMFDTKANTVATA